MSGYGQYCPLALASEVLAQRWTLLVLRELMLDVECDSRTITWIWYGDLPLARALDDGRVALHGPRRRCDSLPSWLQRNVLADVPRRKAGPS